MHRMKEGPRHQMKEGPRHWMKEEPMHRMKEGPMHRMKKGSMHRMKKGPMHRMMEGSMHRMKEGPMHRIKWVHLLSSSVGQTNIGTYVVNNQTIEYELYMKDLFNTVNNVFHWPSLPSSYHSSFPPPCISQTVYNPPCISQTVYNPPCISQTGYNVANLPVVHVCRLLSMSMVSCTCSCIKTSFDTRAT